MTNFTDKLKLKLAVHDWTYEYTDDQRAWKKGHKQAQEIKELLKKLDTKIANDLVNEYAPKGLEYVGRYLQSK
jgi:hypothetical protein